MTMDSDHPHNPVLTRSHEPPRANHAWVAIIPAVIAVVAGVAIWAYVGTQKTTPIVNHAVGSAPALWGGGDSHGG